MGKKRYDKPLFKMIALRPEERLAGCGYYYKIGLIGQGCHTDFLFNKNPEGCMLQNVSVGGS